VSQVQQDKGKKSSPRVIFCSGASESGEATGNHNEGGDWGKVFCGQDWLASPQV